VPADTLVGKVYAGPFGLDVGFGDVLTEPPETVEGSDFLSFAGVSRARHRIYPRVVHIAEKLHAYTLPRPRENSRVKDLPDLARLAQIGPLDGAALRKALDATFAFRKTHELPSSLPVPPASWTARYAKIAREDDLQWESIDVLDAAVRAFLDPVLEGTVETWSPEAWAWAWKGDPPHLPLAPSPPSSPPRPKRTVTSGTLRSRFSRFFPALVTARHTQKRARGL
jgi:hypothetical protein